MSDLKLRHALLALAAAAALAGCGSNDNDDNSTQGPPASSSELPQEALASTDGLIAYMKQLIASMTNETSEPVRLGDATLPVSETAEASN